MVPTLTCGLVRSNFFFAIFPSLVPPFVLESPPRGSNPRPRPYPGRALPTELGGRISELFRTRKESCSAQLPGRVEPSNSTGNAPVRRPRGACPASPDRYLGCALDREA